MRLKIPNGPGVEANGTTLVGKLDNAIGRGSTSRTSGAGGRSPEPGWRRKKYLGTVAGGGVGDENFVVIDTQGNITSVTNNGITNNNLSPAANKVSADFAYNELAAGHSLKMGYSWTGGAHAVDVFATGSIAGVPWVRIQFRPAANLAGIERVRLNSVLFSVRKRSSSLRSGILLRQVGSVGWKHSMTDINGGASILNFIAIGTRPERSCALRPLRCCRGPCIATTKGLSIEMSPGRVHGVARAVGYNRGPP